MLKRLRQSGFEQRNGFFAVLDSYMERQKIYSKRSSVKNARSCVERLFQHFGDVDTVSIPASELDAFISKRRGQGLANKTINGDPIILRAALHHALAVGLIDRLPFKVKLLKVSRKKMLPVLSKSEMRGLLEYARGRYYGIILIASNTGFRAEEILNLQWRDVYFQEGRLAITVKRGWSPKSFQERSCYVSDSVMTYLKKFRLSSHFSAPENYVFSTRSGRPVSRDNAGRQIRKVFNRAGLYQKGRPCLHWIRHSVCSTLLAKGMDIESVREQMGHASITTTQLYAHTSEERMRRASRVLDLG